MGTTASSNDCANRYVHRPLPNPFLFQDKHVDKESVIKFLLCPTLNLSKVRRMALVEAVQQRPSAENEDEFIQNVFLEGIYTCPRLTEQDKQVILTSRYWSEVYEYFFLGDVSNQLQMSSSSMDLRSKRHHEFVRYQHFLLEVLRTSQKMRVAIPQEEHRDRLKTMIRNTKCHADLHRLLERVLHHCCGNEDETSHKMQALFCHDVTTHNYHRLLWPDRLDCDERVSFDTGSDAGAPNSKDEPTKRSPRRLAAQAKLYNSTPREVLSYGKLVLPGDLAKLKSGDSDGSTSCPICLDSLGDAPAVQLDCCHHLFCLKCISDWKRKELEQQKPVEATNAAVSSRWHCPLCRASIDRQLATI